MSGVALVQFPSGGGSVVVEVQEDGADYLPASSGNSEVRVARETFHEALAGLDPIVDSVVERIERFSVSTATVEFGIKLTANAGVVLASAGTEGHFKLTLTWTRTADA